MRLKTLFLCGHESRYGLAHLKPILDSSFNVIAVVLVNHARWSIFRESLNGKVFVEAYPPPVRIARALRSHAIRFLHHTLAERKVRKLCSKKNVPVWSTFDVNENSFISKIKNCNVDLVLSAAFPQIFSKSLIETPRRGSVNFHPSLLPKFRGAHPHFWAIAKGETESGISAHFMTERIDEGNIIAQIPFEISNLSYQQLYDKIVSETPVLVAHVEKFFYKEGATASPQDSSQATYFRNNRDIHHCIFWELLSAAEILNLTRTGMAYCYFRNKPVKIFEVYITKSNRNLTNNLQVMPGAVVDFSNDALVVKAIDGCVNIRVLGNGRRRYPFGKWIKKSRVKIGERFN